MAVGTNYKQLVDYVKLKSVEITEVVQPLIHDDLSAINTDREKQYPVFLMKPTPGRFLDRTMEYKLYDMEIFCFDLDKREPDQSETLETVEEQWARLEGYLRTLVIKILEKYTDYVLTGQIESDYGHLKHNARLNGARVKFQIRVFHGC